MSTTITESLSSSLDRSFRNTQQEIFTQTHRKLQEEEEDLDIVLSFLVRVVAYITILAVTFMVISLIVKFIKECNSEGTMQVETVSESSRLVSKETTSFTYGTCKLNVVVEEKDIESGECSSSSSSEDLYDGKMCVICYDQERNCFFVPCGHCATCYVCAKRIIDGENKNCVICRRLIGKVRKLITS